MDYFEEESSEEGSSASENEDGYEPVIEKGKPWYSLSAAMLDRLGHAVLATEQIINALALAGDNDNTETHFHYDRDFKKLRLLEVGKGRAQVVSVAAVLCARATSARNHIAAFFGVLQAASRNGPPDSDLAVSTDIVSTVTELRRREGKEPLSAELAKYYARPAYARAITKVAPKYADHLRENLKAGRVDVPDIVARSYSLPAYATAEIREAMGRGAAENKVHYRTGLLKFDRSSGVSRLAPPEASTRDPLPVPVERGEEEEQVAETRTVTKPSRTEVRPTRVQERSVHQAAKPSQREERERKQRREYEALSRLGGAPGTSLPVLPGGPLSAAVLTRNAPSRASSLAPEDSVSQVEVGGPSIVRPTAPATAVPTATARSGSRRVPIHDDENALDRLLDNVARGRSIFDPPVHDPPPHHARRAVGGEEERRGNDRATGGGGESRREGRDRERAPSRNPTPRRPTSPAAGPPGRGGGQPPDGGDPSGSDSDAGNGRRGGGPPRRGGGGGGDPDDNGSGGGGGRRGGRNPRGRGGGGGWDALNEGLTTAEILKKVQCIIQAEIMFYGFRK